MIKNIEEVLYFIKTVTSNKTVVDYKEGFLLLKNFFKIEQYVFNSCSMESVDFENILSSQIFEKFFYFEYNICK